MSPFDDAIAFAQAHEIPWPRDPAADPARWGVHHEDPPPRGYTGPRRRLNGGGSAWCTPQRSGSAAGSRGHGTS